MEVPELSDEQIAAQADDLRARYSEACALPRSGPVKPQFYIWDYLDLEEGLSLDLESFLGSADAGGQIAGIMVAEDEGGIIRIDAGIVDTPRYPFTTAHEIGHWVLHRKWVLKARRDGVDAHTITLKRDLGESTSRIEWQADRFAVHLLMPELLVRNEFKKRYGTRVFSFQGSSRSSLYKTKREYSTFLATTGQSPCMSPLYKEFNTSQLAIAIRLEELKLVVD